MSQRAIGSTRLERLLSIQVRIHALNGEIKSPFDEAIQDILEVLLEEVRELAKTVDANLI